MTMGGRPPRSGESNHFDGRTEKRSPVDQPEFILFHWRNGKPSVPSPAEAGGDFPADPQSLDWHAVPMNNGGTGIVRAGQETAHSRTLENEQAAID
jgi:hypothetical protein